MGQLPQRLRMTLGAILVASLAGCAERIPTGPSDASPPSAAARAASLNPTANKAWWDGLSADGQTQVILGHARQDIGKKGGQCKRWVQIVVAAATRNVVTIPPNDGSGLHRWSVSKSYPYVREVANHSSGHIAAHVNSADMIQATAKGRPSALHTMMIESADSKGITIIDSNWRHDEVVRRHSLSYSEFHKMYDRWTLYRVVKPRPRGKTGLA